MQIEFILLILSILFFASILAGKAGSRFGVPALLLRPQSAVKANVSKP
jgi:cell volume regulation protein A